MSHLDPIIDKIIVARVGLLLRHPFFGNMATRLQIKDGSDWCATDVLFSSIVNFLLR